MKKKTFLIVMLALIWINYFFAHQYVGVAMNKADDTAVSNTILLLVFPIMWNYGLAILKFIVSIALGIIILMYQTNDYVDMRKVIYSHSDSAIWKVLNAVLYIVIIAAVGYMLWSNVKYSIWGIAWFLTSLLSLAFYFTWIKNLRFRQNLFDYSKVS